MHRRKYLAALGSIAAGGAAAMGTSAGDSINSNRSLDVDIEGDDGAAYLKLDAEDASSFASNSELSVDFGADSGTGGSGVNNDGTTSARPAFTMKNQFDQTLYVEINNPLANSDITGGGVDVQLLAADTVGNFNSNQPCAFDRDQTIQKLDGDRTDSEELDPSTIPKYPGQPNGETHSFIEGSNASGGSTGGRSWTVPRYVRLDAGSEIYVIARVVANDASHVSLSDSVTVRAFTDQSNMYISDGPSIFAGD